MLGILIELISGIFWGVLICVIILGVIYLLAKVLLDDTATYEPQQEHTANTSGKTQEELEKERRELFYKQLDAYTKASIGRSPKECRRLWQHYMGNFK